MRTLVGLRAPNESSSKFNGWPPPPEDLPSEGGNRIRGVRAIDAYPVSFWSLEVMSEIYTEIPTALEKEYRPPAP